MKKLGNKGLSFIELLSSLALISMVLIFLMALLSNIKNEKAVMASTDIKFMQIQTEFTKEVQDILKDENIDSISYYYDSKADLVSNLTGKANKVIIAIHYGDVLPTGTLIMEITSSSLSILNKNYSSFSEIVDSIKNGGNYTNQWYFSDDKNNKNMSLNLRGITFSKILNWNTLRDKLTKKGPSFVKIELPFENGKNLELTFFNKNKGINVTKYIDSEELTIKEGSINQVDETNVIDALRTVLSDFKYKTCLDENVLDDNNNNGCYIRNDNDFYTIELDCNKEGNECTIAPNIQKKRISRRVENMLGSEISFDIVYQTKKLDSLINAITACLDSVMNMEKGYSFVDQNGEVSNDASSAITQNGLNVTVRIQGEFDSSKRNGLEKFFDMTAQQVIANRIFSAVLSNSDLGIWRAYNFDVFLRAKDAGESSKNYKDRIENGDAENKSLKQFFENSYNIIEVYANVVDPNSRVNITINIDCTSSNICPTMIKEGKVFGLLTHTEKIKNRINNTIINGYSGYLKQIGTNMKLGTLVVNYKFADNQTKTYTLN